jgi:mannose-6-phosphate isomerase-like protein (cupin superfamily)
VTIDSSHGSEHLEQYVIRFAPGRSEPRDLDGRQELLYVASGVGTLVVGESEHALEPGMGAYLVSGESYAVDNPGPAELVVVAVAAPQESTRIVDPERRTVRYADQPVQTAGADREFRYLVNQDVGCFDITQFVGVIPPGRAPMHSHSYDEIVYVIDGEGTLHFGGQETPIGPGSAMHLPPLAEHCLENTGKGSMRVLGVFHPSGDPASRAYDASE